MEISTVSDGDLLSEISRRFEEKQSSIAEMEFLTKKLLAMNEESQQAQEVKSQFLSLIKNEFNNPMSSLLNLSNLMLKKSNDDKLTSIADMMKIELLKLDFSLKNIFAASEIEAGEIANDYSQIQMSELVNEVIDYFSYLIHEKKLVVNFEDRCGDPVISDSQKLDMILLNLLSNACEYSYDDSQIDLFFECDDDEYRIIIEDSGEGVANDHAKDIYNRFSHFESGKTRRTAGLGLGLSVTRGLAEALDGTIDNVTTDEGKTRFVVTFAKVDEATIDLSTGIGANEFMFDDDAGDMVEF
jgi:signal transduction histidine kinase